MPILRKTWFRVCACLNEFDSSRTVPQQQLATLANAWGKMDGVRQAFQPDLDCGAIA